MTSITTSSKTSPSSIGRCATSWGSAIGKSIHYPTESSLIVDGLRKTIELCVQLSDVYDIVGWRQHEHLLKKVKRTARDIARIGARQGAKYKQRLADQYGQLLRPAEAILSSSQNGRFV